MRPTIRRLCWVLFLSVEVYASLPMRADSTEDLGPKQDQYELHYLGCSLKADNFHEHTGMFLFIWKGEKPIYVFGYASQDGKGIDPFASFSIHRDGAWNPVGEWCATGARWLKAQPGQVMTFRIGMGWIEQDSPGWTVQGADKARYNLGCAESDNGKRAGSISSDEFPLPLVPRSAK